MSDIASLSLRVDTGDLQRGNNELDKFQQKATGAAGAADGFNASGKNTAKVSKEIAQEIEDTHRRVAEYAAALNKSQTEAKNHSQATAQQRQELRDLLTQINPVTAAFERLDNMESQLSKFNAKGIIDPESFAEASRTIQQTRIQLERAATARTEEGKAAAAAAQQERAATAAKEAFLSKLQAQSELYKASAADAAAYRAAQLGISQEAAPLIAAMRQQEEAVRREADQKRAAAIASRGLKEALKQQEAAERSAAAETKRAESTRKSFIDSLQDQVNAIGKTRTQLLELKAAKLGVTAESAPLIAKLREQDNQWEVGTISARQYRQALRMLPAQFTDIFTSIAGGMPLWLVLFQQGGQISDSFGGLGGILRYIKEELLGMKDASDESSGSLSENANALAENAEHAKGLAGILSPTSLAIMGLVGVSGLLVTAWYKGSQEAVEYNKQLILTGGYAGKTASQLQDLARSLSQNGLTQRAFASSIAKVVGSGEFSSGAISMVSRVAAEIEDATGQSIDTTIQHFKRLQDEPVKAVMELDRTLHFLTATQLEQIISLEKQGRTADLAKIAMESYASSMSSRSIGVKNNLGTLETAWEYVKDAASGAWDAMLDVGREQSLSSKVEGVRKQLEVARKNLERLEATPAVNTTGYGYGRQNDSFSSREQSQALVNQRTLVGNLTKEYEKLQKSLTDEGLAAGRAKQERDEQERLKNRIKIGEKYNQQYASKATQRKEELAKLDADRWALTDAQYKEYRAEIIRKHKDPVVPKGPKYQPPAGDKAEDSAQADLLALQAQLDVLRQHTDLNDKISQQRKDLWKTQADFTVLEQAAKDRKLKDQEKSLLSSKDSILAHKERLAVLGDEVVKQERLNKLLDAAQKFDRQQQAKRAEIAFLSKGGTARDSQRQSERDRLTTEYADNPVAQKQVLSSLEETYAERDRLEQDWKAGALNGLNEYLEKATDVYSSVSNVAMSALSGISNMMTDLVTTGKASFRDFTTSILKMIVDVINKLLIAYTIQSMMGWIGGGASAATGASAAGSSGATGAMGMSTSWTSYLPGRSGGGYTGDGAKYEPAGVVHRGEFVMTKEATDRIGVDNLYAMMRGYANGGLVGNTVSGSAPMHGLRSSEGSQLTINAPVTINQQGQQQSQSGNGDAVAKAYQQVIDVSVREGIARELRPGGQIWYAQNSR
ncbi:phage tail tape measure protein [Serratia sp. PL7]|uniref:phage tail tape measure protein n=1 Tax=Serratia sp. PL7 TaxID=2952201 RepID=UPI0021AD5C54|nr:phage tail tape measure protein [Serratia sp. PL7]